MNLNDLARAQDVKVNILKDIQLAKQPLEILDRAIAYIAEQTDEPTFADTARKSIQSIYGIALNEPVMLEKELSEVTERLARLDKAFHDKSLPEEHRKRIEYAVLAHKKRLDEISQRLKEAAAED